MADLGTTMGRGRFGVLALLLLSAIAIGVAPLAMPEGYSWTANAISESAAQGQERAWVARLGFLLYGFGVLWLVSSARERWGPWGTFFLGTFGVMMVSTAAFSHKPWQAGVPYDGFEDLLHSVTATGMGFAFAFGVVAVSIRRGARWEPRRILDFVAVGASFVLPLGMSAWPAVGGALQRLMFLIAYVWYTIETLRPLPSR
jgi:hypothetical protein